MIHRLARLWSGLQADAGPLVRECGTRRGRKHTVKKLILLAVVVLGLAALWRKMQADRAELDLWTEATSADE